MDEDKQTCPTQHFLSISVTLVLSILVLIIGNKILQKVHDLIKTALKLILPRQNHVAVNLHKEVAELRRATNQIAKDWRAMTTLMANVRDQQCNFVRRLDIDFEAMGDCLQKSVKVSLDDENARNDERFAKTNGLIADLMEDLHGFRETIETKTNLLSIRGTLKRTSTSNIWTQTDLVMRKRPKEGAHHYVKSVSEASGETESARSAVITVIRKALSEFLKESKKHLSIERDTVMSDMKLIFSQLAEDREDIKNTIESAFSTATHQTQVSFEQFGNVGRDAMKCIAVLSEKSEKAVVNRFQESTEKLSDIFEQLKGLNFDVSSIKQTLDNIDGQFDEIYQKLELGCQRNVEHSESMVNSLQSAAQDWNEKSSNLDDICKQLNDTMRNVHDVLGNLNQGSNVQSQQHTMASMLENISVVAQYSESDGPVSFPKVLQICYTKLTTLNDHIDSGTDGIKQSVEALLQKLRHLTSMVENSVERLKNLNMQAPTENREAKELVTGAGDIRSLDRSETTMKTEATEEASHALHKLKNAGHIPKSPGVLESRMSMTLSKRCIEDVNKNSELFSRLSNSHKTSPTKVGPKGGKYLDGCKRNTK